MKSIDHIPRAVSTAKGKLKKLPCQTSGIHFAALMDDFLVASSVSARLVVRKAMGKGIGIDKSHLHEEEAKRA
jgi:hypothetical protein